MLRDVSKFEIQSPEGVLQADSLFMLGWFTDSLFLVGVKCAAPRNPVPMPWGATAFSPPQPGGGVLVNQQTSFVLLNDIAAERKYSATKAFLKMDLK